MTYLVNRRCEFFEQVVVNADSADEAENKAKEEIVALSNDPGHFLHGKLESVITWTPMHQDRNGEWVANTKERHG